MTELTVRVEYLLLVDGTYTDSQLLYQKCSETLDEDAIHSEVLRMIDSVTPLGLATDLMVWVNKERYNTFNILKKREDY